MIKMGIFNSKIFNYKIFNIVGAGANRMRRIREFHKKYGSGPYCEDVKREYSDVLYEVKEYKKDGTWITQCRKT